MHTINLSSVYIGDQRSSSVSNILPLLSFFGSIARWLIYMRRVASPPKSHKCDHSPCNAYLERFQSNDLFRLPGLNLKGGVAFIAITELKFPTEWRPDWNLRSLSKLKFPIWTEDICLANQAEPDTGFLWWLGKEKEWKPTRLRFPITWRTEVQKHLNTVIERNLETRNYCKRDYAKLL